MERFSRLDKITKKYFKNFNSILKHKHFTKSRFVNLKQLHQKNSVRVVLYNYPMCIEKTNCIWQQKENNKRGIVYCLIVIVRLLVRCLHWAYHRCVLAKEV